MAVNPIVLKVIGDFLEGLDQSRPGPRAVVDRGVGTGKTALAMLISKSAVEAGRTVAIYSLPRSWPACAPPTSKAGGDSYMEFFARLASVDLLHIDDLGVEKRSDWVLEQLYAIVNERYEMQRSMLVTTNLDQEALEEQIGRAHRLAPDRDLRRPAAIDGDDLRYPRAPEY